MRKPQHNILLMDESLGTQNGEPAGVVSSRAFDALIALGAAFLSTSIFVGLSQALSVPFAVVAIIIILIHTLSLYWRRQFPWLVLWVNLASGMAIVALGLPMVILALAPLIALYSVSSYSPRTRSAWAVAAIVFGLFASEAIAGFPQDLSTIVGNCFGVFSAWLLGTFVFSRQRYIDELEVRTTQLAAAHEELARKAATEERLRIARELHDVVAHSLSMIAVQSGVGAHVMDTQPEEGRRALATIERVSRQALDEMRRFVGILRGGDEEVSLSPLPGLSEMNGLIEQVSAAGPEVELQVSGEARALPTGADVTAYRIVQESLTNVVKHAGADRARVVLNYAPDRLIIEVVDNGHGTRHEPAKGGHGLHGMRERVELFGGTLDARSLREGGFRVRAELPLEGEVA